MEGKFDDKYYDDGHKHDDGHKAGTSSPRKRLMQAKLNADAIETENSKVESHRVTKKVTKSFVEGILSNGINALSEEEDTKDSKK